MEKDFIELYTLGQTEITYHSGAVIYRTFEDTWERQRHKLFRTFRSS